MSPQKRGELMSRIWYKHCRQGLLVYCLFQAKNSPRRVRHTRNTVPGRLQSTLPKEDVSGRTTDGFKRQLERQFEERSIAGYSRLSKLLEQKVIKGKEVIRRKHHIQNTGLNQNTCFHVTSEVNFLFFIKAFGCNVFTSTSNLAWTNRQKQMEATHPKLLLF